MFGGSNICKELYDFITNQLEQGSTILEFGSGEGSTGQLSKLYKMYSVEHDSRYVGAYDSTYCHAPIDLNQNWYSLDKVKPFLSEISYDMVLIDGPVGSKPRFGAFNNRELLDLKGKWLIIDDTHREGEIILFHNFLQSYNVSSVFVSDYFSAMLIGSA